MRARLRPDLPFRRIAVVLAGGGAFGAYEVGVLRALGIAGLDPAIVAGASAGAMNAVVWVAQGKRTKGLEETWKSLEPASIGIRWSTLAWRALGAFLLTFGILSVVLTLLGSPELSVATWLRGRGVSSGRAASLLLDVLAWALLSGIGAIMLRTSREAEEVLARAGESGRRRVIQTGAIAFLLGWAALHVIAWVTGMPWPHRFSALLLTGTALVWTATRSGRAGQWLRRSFGKLLPEAKGCGVWGDVARRRTLERLVRDGSPSRLVSGQPVLILTGLALDTGRVAMFVAGEEPHDAFRAAADRTLGEVVWVRTPDEVMDAAIASSAIPIIFEPGSVAGRPFIDAVALSTHPLRAALFAGADAALVVVVAPSNEPPAPRPLRNMIDLWGRYIDIANWRDFQRELRALPKSWTEDGTTHRLCVVEPDDALPGGTLSYSPRVSERLLEQGEADAWRALAAAGWLESTGEPARDPAPIIADPAWLGE